MFNYLHGAINRISSRKLATILLSTTLLLMLIINKVNVAASIPRIAEVSNGASVLDARLYYTSSEAYKALDALHQAGRDMYLKFLTTFDLAFPLLYSITLAVILTIILRSPSFNDKPWTRKLNIVPFVAGMFDYLENGANAGLLLNYPTHIDALSAVAGYFTLGKWMFSLLNFLLIFIGLVLRSRSREPHRAVT